MDVEDYIKEANRQLNNTDNYKQLQNDPTSTHAELVNTTIERFKKESLLSESIAEGLKSIDPRTPKFYMLPKIHKEDNPGRPVVSSVNCHTSNISKYVDYHLQPIVNQIPSYVKDTTDFLQKLDAVNNIPEDSLLVTLDVKSLYTSIPNNEGIKAVKEAYEKHPSKTVSTKVIITFLSLILTLNNFIFNSIHYLQVMGCAMGTICAPSYANIFMAKFEQQYIYPFIKDMTSLYLRYIDDIFIIWKGTKEELQSFIKDLNTKHRTIKFDYKISEKQISFLDTMVYKDQNKKIQTTIYRKPTDKQAYLHAHSEHPKSLKNSIPYSQALRIKSICSTTEEFDKNMLHLKEKFLERGYKEDTLNSQMATVKDLNRNDVLKKQETKNTNKIPLLLTYNRTLPNMKAIVEQYWNILQINTDLQPVFQTKPMIAYKRNKNLKEIIGGNTIVNSKVFKRQLKDRNGKCKPCNGNKSSLCCKQVVNTTTFTSNQTKRTFKIFHQVNCKSNFIIYLLECTLCKLQYVGKSETPFNLRLNNHRKDVKDINNSKAIPACTHFRKNGHDFNIHAKFTIIEQLNQIKTKSQDYLKILLKQRENFWIKTLDTLTPKGLNQELNNV